MESSHNPFHDDTAPVSSPVQLMILALFFQLLVFFILMNSISAFSKKADDVLKSMRQALGDDSIARIDASGIFPQLTIGTGTGMSLKDLGGLFQNDVPGLKAATPLSSGVLEITLPANEFNQLLGLTGPRRVHPELLTMIEFIKTYPKVDYRLQLLKNIRAQVMDQTSRRNDPTYAYLMMWGSALTQLGLPHDKFEYGIATGQPGTVTLRIIANDLPDQASPVQVPK